MIVFLRSFKSQQRNKTQVTFNIDNKYEKMIKISILLFILGGSLNEQ